jgi:hypothetical protein
VCKKAAMVKQQRYAELFKQFDHSLSFIGYIGSEVCNKAVCLLGAASRQGTQQQSAQLPVRRTRRSIMLGTFLVVFLSVAAGMPNVQGKASPSAFVFCVPIASLTLMATALMMESQRTRYVPVDPCLLHAS